MIGAWTLILALATGLWGFAAPAAAAPPREPVAIIFDTDMWSDIDDPMALAVLHALADRGEARILAVTLSTHAQDSVDYVELVDRYYGRGDIPIGMVNNDGMNAARFFAAMPGWTKEPLMVRGYPQAIVAAARARGDYPRRDARAEDAVAVLRRTLASAADGSVVIVQVGYATNMAHLLASAPDSASPLDGRALVARKVRRLVIMGGNFGDLQMATKLVPAGSAEFNIKMDAGSAQVVFADWPTPIVASGFEIGEPLRYPGTRLARDFAYDPHHPVAETYRYVNPMWSRLLGSTGPMHDHSLFDLTAVLYAVRPEAGYYGLSPAGTIRAEPDGRTRFSAGADGRDRHLTLAPADRPRVLEALELLVSQPPHLPPPRPRR